MLLSRKFVSDYIDLPENLTSSQIAYDLTLRTVEVENVEDLGAKFNNIVVGKIEKISAHPNADKLLISQVNIGSETRQVISGIAKYYKPEEVIGKTVVEYNGNVDLSENARSESGFHAKIALKCLAISVEFIISLMPDDKI